MGFAVSQEQFPAKGICASPPAPGAGFPHTVNLASLNGIADGLGALSVNLAADAVRGAENLLHCSLQFLGEGLESHCPGNLDDLVEGDRLAVLDVFLLLAVSGGLLQSLDDESRSSGNDGDSGLTVLDGKLHGDTESLL